MNTRMKHKARTLFWIKLLTLVWLAFSTFAYPNALYVKYIEPDKTQNAIETSSTPNHWYFINESNDTPIDFMESFWRSISDALVFVDDAKSNALHLSDSCQYQCLNQITRLISFQYFHSGLPA